ncbi:MAG TPA: hypothetical protein VLS96_13245 [Nodosilinea sp.]|nr:hypothetical protein [Nodosilinea sp.]
MDTNEFEARYREQIRDILNQLQSAMVVSAQLELTIGEVSDTVQALNRDVERFIAAQGGEAEGDSAS